MLSKVICYKFGKEVFRQDYNSYELALREAIDKNWFENLMCIILVYDEMKKKWIKQSSLYVRESY